MKKNEERTEKKLQLHRETLQALQPRELEEVFGAMPCRTSGTGTSFPSVCLC